MLPEVLHHFGHRKHDAVLIDRLKPAFLKNDELFNLNDNQIITRYINSIKPKHLKFLFAI